MDVLELILQLVILGIYLVYNCYLTELVFTASRKLNEIKEQLHEIKEQQQSLETKINYIEHKIERNKNNASNQTLYTDIW